jgi:hypothetical protein
VANALTCQRLSQRWHRPIVAYSRAFPAQKEEVTASAYTIPQGRILIPFAKEQSQKSTH